MNVVALVGAGRVVDDACPYGRQRQEDAHNGKHHGTDFRNFVKNPCVKLKGGEYACVESVMRMTQSRRQRTWDDHSLAAHDEDNLHRTKL